ncbi:MAG: HAMP domain-containing histidine kinase, partial [Acidobacteria bacterium]|nr:HAMP domain-containing histidine kinase [Acidobacteriota bacterium]
EKSRALEAATAELRAANEQLKELDRLKDEFLSTMTHELRTPLTSIRAFTEILHHNPDLDQQRRDKFLGIILKENERLTRLIGQVLDLAKIESGAMDWNLSEVDLAAVVQESAVSMSQVCQENGVDLEIEVPSSVPPLAVDRDRMMQVLLNLLSNAVKFCRGGEGWVRVRLAREADRLQVSVEDNGPGIEPSLREVVFERFRQLADSGGHSPNGSGLGLPISRQIVSHFGGRMWVEGGSRGGARFCFCLPLADREPPIHSIGSDHD